MQNAQCTLCYDQSPILFGFVGGHLVIVRGRTKIHLLGMIEWHHSTKLYNWPWHTLIATMKLDTKISPRCANLSKDCMFSINNKIHVSLSNIWTSERKPKLVCTYITPCIITNIHHFWDLQNTKKDKPCYHDNHLNQQHKNREI